MEAPAAGFSGRAARGAAVALKLRCHWQRTHNDGEAASCCGMRLVRLLAVARPMRRDDMVLGVGVWWLMKLEMTKWQLPEGVGGFFLGPTVCRKAGLVLGYCGAQ